MTPAELIQYINEHLPSNNRIRMDVLRDVLHQLAQAATGGIIEIISQEVQGEVKARIEFNEDHFLIETIQGGGIKINLKNPGGGGGGIPDAPMGDIIYARKDGEWINITSLFNQKENTGNKRKTFNLPDHTTYPTTQGVVDYLEAILEEYVKEDALENFTIKRYYENISQMVGARNNQTRSNILYVQDASDDASITFEEGEDRKQAIYQFEETSEGGIDDYTLISAPYSITGAAGVKKINDITGEITSALEFEQGELKIKYTNNSAGEEVTNSVVIINNELNQSSEETTYSSSTLLQLLQKYLVKTVYDTEIGGQRNGVNTLFTVAEPYEPGTLKVYLNGILLQKGNNADFIESNPGQINNGANLNRIVTHTDLLIFEYRIK